VQEVADLVITSDDPQLPSAKVALKGAGVMLGLSISPMAGIDFGMVQLGKSGGPTNVTLTNTGNAPIEITNLVLSGGGAPRFMIAKATPFTIGVGGSEMLPVTYTPAIVGMDSATLTVAAQGLMSAGLPLKGAGVQPMVGVTPMTLDFGPIPIGKSSMPRAVTFMNNSSQAVTIGNVMPANGAFTVDQSATTKMLPAGMSTTFTVTFSPTMVGPVTTDVNVMLMGATAPVAKVVVTGSGVNAPAPAGGCSVAGPRAGGALGLAALAAVALLALALRRRR